MWNAHLLYCNNYPICSPTEDTEKSKTFKALSERGIPKCQKRVAETWAGCEISCVKPLVILSWEGPLALALVPCPSGMRETGGGHSRDPPVWAPLSLNPICVNVVSFPVLSATSHSWCRFGKFESSRNGGGGKRKKQARLEATLIPPPYSQSSWSVTTSATTETVLRSEMISQCSLTFDTPNQW